MPALPIPYEAQAEPDTHRGCGAAALSMVYKSFGKDVPQASIWPLIAKPNRLASVASTTHLMAQHAIGQGFSAVAIQARHPIQVLRRSLDAGVRVILNHRLQTGSPAGHYTVLVDIDDNDVVLHDPFFGASRRMPHAKLTELWQPSSPNAEIAGNVLIGIAKEAPPAAPCEFCHTTMVEQVNCPRCKMVVALSPSAVLGCIRDGCIARMWNYICCPACDSLFDETGKAASGPATTASGTKSPLPEPPNLEKVYEEVEKFCAMLMSRPKLAEHPDLKAQIDFMRASVDKLKAAQIEELAGMKAYSERFAAFAAQSREKTEAHRKRAEAINVPLAPLDGNALGAALLKTLGFK